MGFFYLGVRLFGAQNHLELFSVNVIAGGKQSFSHQTIDLPHQIADQDQHNSDVVSGVQDQKGKHEVVAEVVYFLLLQRRSGSIE